MSCLRTILLVSAVFAITVDSFGFFKIVGGEYDNGAGGDDDYDNGDGGAGGDDNGGEEGQCPEVSVDKLQCPEGSIAFKRTPTAQNLCTSLWCLQVFVSKEKLISSYANALCGAKNYGVLSTFENQAEQEAIYSKASALFKQNGIAYGSITVDGKRNYECMYNNTQFVPPCTKNGTFRLIDQHTDPAFFFSNWDVAEPNGDNIMLAEQYTAQECVHMYISKDSHPKQDRKFHDMFCDFAISPTNPDQLISSYGYVCGWEPKAEKWSINP